MIPVLFKEDEQVFSHNGIGALYESLSCDVLEEENGAFTMELEYPVDGELFSEIKDFRIIQAKPNDIDEPHNFRIYEIEKSIDELTVYVRANTRTNDLGNNLITNYVGKGITPQQAMNGIKNNLIEPTNFDLISDIQTRSNVDWTRINPLNAIVGVSGSLVDLWGGQIKRTNTAIHLYSRRGRDNVVTIRPGKNIEGLNMTVSTAGLVTKILPTYTYRPVDVPKYRMVTRSDGSKEKERVTASGSTTIRDDITVLGDVVSSQYVDNYPTNYWSSVDYGDDNELKDKVDAYVDTKLKHAEESPGIVDMSGFETDLKNFVKTELDKKAKQYFTHRNPGVDRPTVRIKVDMLQLSDSPDWEEFKDLERIGLTDTLDVWVEEYDIDVEVRVTSLTYDSIAEHVTNFNAGSDKAPRQSAIEKKYDDLTKATDDYITSFKNGVQNIMRNTADGLNRKFEGYTEPPAELSSEGDIWFKEIGEGKVEIWIHDGVYWQPLMTEDFGEKLLADIEATQAELEEAKQQAKEDSEQALVDAKAHADAEVERIEAELSAEVGDAIETAEQAKADAVSKANQALADAKAHAEAEDTRIKQEIGLEVDSAIEIAEQAKADAVTKANQALIDAKAHAEAEILRFSDHFDGVLSEVESDVADAQATADSAVELINTDIADKFTSIDSVIGDLNSVAMSAEQSAQQAITNASDAYGLAQTSIVEAQTAQVNSLAALSEAEDASAGVSSLNTRVDEVEGELETKADNTFMTEDGDLVTLSNAITLNAHKFSSAMSRIESRVESLAGAVNLVVLRGAIEGARLIGGEVFPNAHKASNTIDNDTMAEMIDVEVGEQLALSKETTDNDNFWRISFYLDNNYVSRITAGDNQHILTVPSGVNRMWVSYPKGSKPQIVRGTDFLPYRSNVADQMTTNEMVVFRNEYDEFADTTERRMSAIDGTGGSLDVLNNRITTEAGLVRTDMTAYIETKVGNNKFAEFYQNEYLETAGEVSRKISLTDVEIGGRNLLVKSGDGYTEGYSVGSSTPGNPPLYTIREYDAISNHINVINEGVEDYYTFSRQDSLVIDDGWFRIYWISKNGGVIRRDTSNENVFITKKPENAVTLRFSFPKDSMAKVEQGNIATGYSEAPEDTDAKIGHVQTEWSQAHNAFKQTVSNDFGVVNRNVQTLENSLSAITNPVTGRLSVVEQAADGLQETVMDTTTGLSATRSQMTEGFNQMVSSNFIRKRNFENGMTGNWGGQGIVENLGSLSPINGMTKAFKWETRNAFEEGNVFDVSPGETYYIEFVVNTFYAKYPVRFGLNTYGPLGENVGFNATIEVPSGQPTQKVTGTITIPTTGANTPYTKARPLLQIYGPNDSDLGFAYVTALAISPNANNSQIAHLEDNINLRVKEGDVLSQINIEAERTLIQTGKLLLDAKNTIVTGDFAVSGNAIVGGDMQLNNGLRVMNGTDSVLSIVDGNVRMNVGSLFIGSEDVEDKIGTAIYQNSKSLGLIYTDGAGQEQSLIGVSADGVHIEGKHIILNGQTVVNDDFTVAGNMVSKGIIAENITTGTINTARLDAKSIVTEGLEVDVIKAKHISADTVLINKLFADEANIGVLTAKTAFIDSIKAVEIDASKIESGIIDSARINASDIVTKGLTADVIKSTHISADTALFDKLFTSDLATDRLSAQRAWIKNANIANASISGAKIEDATISSAKIVKLDVAKISGGTTNFVRSNWNSINSNLSVNGSELSYKHSDGSYTTMNAKGLFHKEGGVNYQSHYLMETGTVSVESNHLKITQGVRVTLPSIFKGKPFKVIVGVADVLSYAADSYPNLAIQRIVAFVAKDSIDHANGQFRVFGYARMVNIKTYKINYVPVQVQYTAIV